MSVLLLCVFGLLLLTSSVSAEDKKPVNLNFYQSDYKIKFEWGQIVRYNKQYLEQFDVVVFKYNRSCTALNLTYLYKVEVGNDLEVLIQAYKFLSNEYRYFPVRAQYSMCKGLANNLMGFSNHHKSCGNYTGCPVKKGKRAHLCNFAPNPSKFPPFIPTGRYKLEFQGLYRDVEMWLMHVYGEVYRPLAYD